MGDGEVGDDELRRWIDESRASVERYRGLRRRCMVAGEEERRELLRRHGLASIREIDAMARIARANLASYERALAARAVDGPGTDAGGP